MLQTRSSITLVAVTNTVNASGVIITNSGGLYAMQSGAWNVGITNTLPGWQVKLDSTSIVNSAGWVVGVSNTAGWSVAVANTLPGWQIKLDSTSIVNSAGWVVAISNTAGLSVSVGSVSIVNSAGWVVNVANTGGAINILNSGGLYAMQSGVWSVSSTILNSAGWVVSQANTAGMTVNVINSAGWSVAVANTLAGWQVKMDSTSIVNSAGWVIAQSNTAGMTAYALDSAATGTVTTNIASTIGTVVLAGAQVKRTNLAIYNASTQPMYMKLGSGAKATDFTLMMVGSGYYELPRPVYNGQITGVWVTANGFAMVSENT